ncbi:late competence protein ComER [Terrilactibacillus laevilacticus]|uniref:late competence protein ComER n=1 Tax=Terrilactibacillus laevilacticus TaxID=1380157 RepID=UPI0011466B78|nr:late competence protein ComER [Terrilactibacillus laevilacticus]
MTIGVIGTGNMGTLLIESFIRSKAIQPSEFVITNRTLSKAESLSKKYEGIQVVPSAKSVFKEAKTIFICVKPLSIYPLLKEANDVIEHNHLVISITSPIRVEQLESSLPCPAARVIPSIVNQTLSGSTLLTFGERCTEEVKTSLTLLLQSISNPIEIEEEITRVSSDLSSCGPAFLSYLFERMISAAVSTTEITEEKATQLLTDMVIGVGKLFEEKTYTLDTLKKKVMVKGGVTGVGIQILEDELGEVFEHLFKATQMKFVDDHKEVDPQYSIKPSS